MFSDKTGYEGIAKILPPLQFRQKKSRVMSVTGFEGLCGGVAFSAGRLLVVVAVDF
jgi:hypothetical protein